MGRPRKIRFGEYTALAAEELRLWLSAEIDRAVRAALAEQRQEIAAVRDQLSLLARQFERGKPPRRRRKIGRWVPGGPGRPPKDAVARAEAFAARQRKPRSR